MIKTILNNEFILDGKLQHEKEDLTNKVFENLDFKEELHQISFFRSDFRGSKFKNIIFCKNNFDRADFIHCYFENVKFTNVELGCCQMKNCYFKSCQFEYNTYKNTSIHLSNFEDCTFNEETFLINMQNCKLVDSSFKNCTFERSTTENDTFELCDFNNVNFATMHAEYHTFIKCDFIDTKFDFSYFFGYLMENVKLEEIMFLYRGELVKIDIEIHEMSIYEQLICENRYFEALNYLVISRKYDSIKNELKGYLEKLVTQEDIFRKNEIDNIFKAFTFYLKYDKLSYSCLYSCISLFSSYNWKQFSAIQSLEYLSKAHFLETLLAEVQHNKDFLDTIPEQEISLIELTFKTEDFDEAILKSTMFFKTIGCVEANNYNLLDKKKGSWVLMFTMSTVLLISILPRALRVYNSMYWEIKLKAAASKKTLSLLTETKSIKELSDILSMADSNQLINDEIPSPKEIAIGLESIKVNI